MPQPIDPNTELGRITAAERIQQVADRASLAAQARLTEDANTTRVNSERQVHETEQKSQEVDEELRRRTPYVGKRRKKKKDAHDPETNAAARTFYTPGEGAEIVDDPDNHNLDLSV